jgi:dephospho-CoA kinase
MERGVDEKRARSIIGSQMPIEEKRKLADHVIDNSGRLDATREQVNNFCREIHL